MREPSPRAPAPTNPLRPTHLDADPAAHADAVKVKVSQHGRAVNVLHTRVRRRIGAESRQAGQAWRTSWVCARPHPGLISLHRNGTALSRRPRPRTHRHIPVAAKLVDHECAPRVLRRGKRGVRAGGFELGWAGGMDAGMGHGLLVGPVALDKSSGLLQSLIGDPLPPQRWHASTPAKSRCSCADGVVSDGGVGGWGSRQRPSLPWSQTVKPSLPFLACPHHAQKHTFHPPPETTCKTHAAQRQ